MNEIIYQLNLALKAKKQKAKDMDSVVEMVFSYFVNRKVLGFKGVPDDFESWVLSLLSNKVFLLHRGSWHLINELSYGSFLTELTHEQRKRLLQLLCKLELPMEANVEQYIFELKTQLAHDS